MQILPYLDELGASHLYLSPVFRARPGSQHGYDVIDHSRLNPELGSTGDFRALAEACRARGMGIVLDIVPNHMAVMSADNAWWMDVLENGPASRYAGFFDIDWTPARASMRNRLLVPLLAQPLGEAIDAGEIGLVFNPASGSFSVTYGQFTLPLDPLCYPQILQRVPEAALLSAGMWREFSSLCGTFASLPPARPASDEVLARRYRDKEAAKLGLANLCAKTPAVGEVILQAVALLNEGRAADRSEFLASLLAAQPYRLAFWRIAGDEINYRRFFDVNELAALRMEDAEVFGITHALVRELWREGLIDGVRVDHADGLFDPAGYFCRLRELLGRDASGRTPYIVAEKILAENETLPAGWEVQGTTGYEFGALVSGWLLHPGGAVQLEKIYRRFTGRQQPFPEIAYESRKRVMASSLAAEISMLANRLDRIAQLHHSTTDFTLFDLRQAIVEVIANFPVYRTYASADGIRPEDSAIIRRAVGAAMGRRQTLRRALDFLAGVLLGETGGGAAQETAALEFTRRFQQVSSPVMAKGVEDTAIYRHSCLLPMNEVGADPQSRGISSQQFHAANLHRAQHGPACMLATSTHDTKRGEDPRHRLCVLSEMSGPWQQCLGRWRRLKRKGREGALPAPDLEYLLLQSALGIWPGTAGDTERASLAQRLTEYAWKAAREAKEETSWIDPDTQYEETLRSYVQLLIPENPTSGFARYFAPLIEPVQYFGMLNSLAAVTLKLTAPGVPDIYQGNEQFQPTLVDPDNRRAVDFADHAAQLERIHEQIRCSTPALVAAQLLRCWQDGAIKMFITTRLLSLRRRWPGVFASADYQPVATGGLLADHIMSYWRCDGTRHVLVVVCRWAAVLSAGRPEPPLGIERWSDAVLDLPAGVPGGSYVDALTGQVRVIPAAGQADRQIAVGELFDVLPLCVLVLEEGS